MKPICVPCRPFFRPKKNDYFFIEGMPLVENALPGVEAPAQWTPDKVWAADLGDCEGGGATILSGFGLEPICEHYQQRFAETIKQLGADQFQVNDC